MLEKLITARVLLARRVCLSQRLATPGQGLLAVADATKHHVVEIPLLFEKGLAAEFDGVVCVACSDDVRLARLEARGLARLDALARINSQIPIGQKVMNSNYVLWNDGDRSALEAQVNRLVARLTAAEKSVF